MRRVTVSLPFGRGQITAELPDELTSVVAPKPWAQAGNPGALIDAALARPVAGPRLCDLARNCSRAVVITSDHTRALPSRLTLPLLLAEARRFRADLEVTLLIATGLHRPPTQAEIEERFGPEILATCRVVAHDAASEGELVDLGVLSTGTRLLVNGLAAEAELLIAEGLIEPHFFAGFSGGRKSLMPGVSGTETVMRNHRPELIDHPRARNGVLEGNPIHEEALEGARLAGLRFILNVVVTSDGSVVAAVAGEPDAAHRAGASALAEHATCRVEPAPIVVVSNFGYPLDRDFYQCVKGLSVAGQAALPGGTLIVAAECRDGIGHQGFFSLASLPGGPQEILRTIRSGAGPLRDAWQVQILARVLTHQRAIVVSPGVRPEEAQAMQMEWAPDLGTALDRARRRHGASARITVIPEGPGTIIAGG